MPQPNVRHSRDRWEWGNPPARSAEMQAVLTEEARATTIPAARSPGRKDTASWCRGKAGRPHISTIAFCFDRWGTNDWKRCGWAPVFEYKKAKRYVVSWSCRHREECQNCGKILTDMGRLSVSQCPDYPGTAEQKQAAMEKAIAWQDKYANRVGYVRRKPVITGPQGYRRKRDKR